MTLDEERGGVVEVAGHVYAYSFARVGAWDEVLACPPANLLSIVSATSVAKDMVCNFSIKVRLMVGICARVLEQEGVRQTGAGETPYQMVLQYDKHMR